MHDLAGYDQGAGLRQLAAHTAPRLLCVVHHGDRSAEMTLLWQLCNVLHRLGYALSVLDTTTPETPESPGLQGMLDGTCRPQAPGAGAWPIVPAAGGIQQLMQSMTTPQSGRQTLDDLFREFGALVVYADAETLTDTFARGQIKPVLALSPDMPSLLSAYRSLKHLAAQGSMKAATVVTVRPYDSPVYLAQNIAKSLRNCTMNYLKCRIRHFETSTGFDTEKQPDDMRRLALYLLDDTASSDSLPRQSGQVHAAHAPLMWSH